MTLKSNRCVTKRSEGQVSKELKTPCSFAYKFSQPDLSILECDWLKNRGRSMLV